MAPQTIVQDFIPFLHEAWSHPEKTGQNLNIFNTQITMASLIMRVVIGRRLPKVILIG
jgi:hypothetical protein